MTTSKTTFKVGDRVRANMEYCSVQEGWLGTYYGSPTGYPDRACVAWDKHSNSGSIVNENVPKEQRDKVYNVPITILELYTGTALGVPGDAIATSILQFSAMQRKG